MANQLQRSEQRRTAHSKAIRLQKRQEGDVSNLVTLMGRTHAYTHARGRAEAHAPTRIRLSWFLKEKCKSQGQRLTRLRSKRRPGFTGTQDGGLPSTSRTGRESRKREMCQSIEFKHSTRSVIMREKRRVFVLSWLSAQKPADRIERRKSAWSKTPLDKNSYHQLQQTF